MRIKILALFLFAAAALAQRPVPIFPPDLRTFLGLTDAQVQAIARANGDYAEYSAQKFLRMAQVQQEIAEETGKDVLDPGALGIRYAELEAIRRDLNDQLQRTREKVMAPLTDPQKAKLKTLDEARRLQPLIQDAECTNLLAPLPQFLTGVISPFPVISPFLPGVPFPNRGGCLSFAVPPGLAIGQP